MIFCYPGRSPVCLTHRVLGKLHRRLWLPAHALMRRVYHALSPHPHTYYLIGRTKSSDSRPDLVLNLRTGQARRFEKAHSGLIATSYSAATTIGQQKPRGDGPMTNSTNDNGPQWSSMKAINFAEGLLNAQSMCTNCEGPVAVTPILPYGRSQEPLSSITLEISIHCSTCGTGMDIALTGVSFKTGA